MLKTAIIHPELLAELGKCGHKARILLADSNYAFASNKNAKSKVIYLNFAKDMLSATDILQKLTDTISIESVTMMSWPDDFDNSIAREYQSILGQDIQFSYLERADFYAAVKDDSTCLIIATGESRRFANLLLTVGVVK